MSVANQRFADTFNSFASAINKRREGDNEFNMDKMQKAFQDHLAKRNESMDLVATATSLMEAPKAYATLKSGISKVTENLNDRAIARAMPEMQSSAAQAAGEGMESFEVESDIPAASSSITNAMNSVRAGASEAVDVATNAVGSASRAIIGEAATDTIGDIATTAVAASSEILGPLSVFALIGMGIGDLIAGSQPTPKSTSTAQESDPTRTRIVAPSFNSRIQQSSGSISAF